MVTGKSWSCAGADRSSCDGAHLDAMPTDSCAKTTSGAPGERLFGDQQDRGVSPSTGVPPAFGVLRSVR